MSTLPAAATATAATRRVPPPCWTDDETLALVSAYRDKWLALRRGNLRAADWDAVSETVKAVGGGAKSAMQCRHKIEKLRKRYRAEKQRCLNRPGKFYSSWDLFPALDAMGFASTPAVGSCPEVDLGGGDDGFGSRLKNAGSSDDGLGSDLGSGVGFGMKLGKKVRGRDCVMVDEGFSSDVGLHPILRGEFGLKRKHNGDPRGNDYVHRGLEGDRGLNMPCHNGFGPTGKRSRKRGDNDERSPSVADFVPAFGGSRASNRNLAIPAFKSKYCAKNARSLSSNFDYDDCINDGVEDSVSQSADFGFANEFGSSSKPWHTKSGGGSRVRTDFNPIEEVVSSVKMFTEVFMRMEKSKIDMAREMEKSRMEMESKQFEVMLESHRQMVEAFSEALFSGEDEKKGMSTVVVPTSANGDFDEE